MSYRLSHPIWHHLIELSFDLMLWRGSFPCSWEKRWFQEVQFRMASMLNQTSRDTHYGRRVPSYQHQRKIEAFLGALSPYLALMGTKCEKTRKLSRRLEHRVSLMEQWLKMSHNGLLPPSSEVDE